MRPVPTIADVIGAAALALVVGLLIGAQLAHWGHASDCAEVISAERACVDRVDEYRRRLADLVSACGYGRGA